jgi:hypothetical protein
MSKLSLTPNKQVSAGAIVALIAMIIFGIGFAVLVGNVLSENDAPPLMSFLFYVFMVLWIGTVLFTLIYHVKNYKRKGGFPLLEIQSDSDNKKDNSPMQRLRDLEALKKDGIINEKEYDEKRTQIMEEKW